MNGACVVGSSKMGTTGLYSAVWHGLRRQETCCYGLLEKYDPDRLHALERLAPTAAVVAKFLLTSKRFSPSLVEPFSRRLLIVRDPRDTLLSVAMYYPVLAANRGIGDERISRYVELVREKERDPGSHSFLDLLVEVHRLMGREVDERTDFSRRFRRAMRFHATESAFLVHYERLVADDLGDASDYLGFEIHNERPSDYSGIVLRTGGVGEWRHWFTPRDVEVLRPMLAPYMEQFGYEDEWELAAEPSLAPSQGSEYVLGAVAKRRRQRALRKEVPRSGESLQQLRDRADEGALRAAVQLARTLLAEDPVVHAEEIRHHLRFAACCGDVPAMRQLAEVLEQHPLEPDDAAQARRWAAEAAAEDERQRLREAAAVGGAREVERLRRELEATRARLDATRGRLAELRGSRRMRLAAALSEAARGGVGAKIRLPAALWRLRRAGPRAP